MSGELLLVGSIPLDTPQEVFQTFGAPLGRYLFACPTATDMSTARLTLNARDSSALRVMMPLGANGVVLSPNLDSLLQTA